MATITKMPLYQDIYRPVLKSGTPSLKSTPEQNMYIKGVLDVACSDSRFAQKAYDAISYILSQEVIPVVPAVTSVTPESAPVGSTLLNLTVEGTDFVAGTEVLWNGTPVPTNFTNDTSVSASVDVTLVAAPEAFTVEVQNPVAIKSNSVPFNIVAAGLLSTPASKGLAFDQKKEVHPTLERK